MGSLVSRAASLPAEKRAGATDSFMASYRRRRGLEAVPGVDAGELDRLRLAGDNPLVVDCRPAAEREVSVIGGGVEVVPLDRFEADLGLSLRRAADAGRRVVAACTIGARSCDAVARWTRDHPDAAAAARVANFDGSLVAWAHRGLPLVDPATGEPTMRIHSYNSFFSRYVPATHEAVW